MESHLSQSKIVTGIILFAILTRITLFPLIGHPPNFSAIDAIALFCGAYFSRPLIALLVVISSVWLGDVLLSQNLFGQWHLFYPGWYWQYLCYAMIILLGSLLNQSKRNASAVLFASLSASTLFFIISNFGVWFYGVLYPLTLQGLITCYIAAIPFFKNTVVSDLFFTGLLFGGQFLLSSFFGLRRLG